MNRTITFSIGAILIGCGMVFAAMQYAPATPSVVGTVAAFESVTPAQFEALAASGEYTVIDVRTEEEAAGGKVIANAKVIDYYKPNFRDELAKLDRNQQYLIYCRSGNRTGDTLKIMKSLGFTKVRDLKGGKNAWEQSGRTLVASDCESVTCS